MNQKPSIYGPRFSWIMTKKWYRVDSAICHISKSRLKKLIKLFFFSEMKKKISTSQILNYIKRSEMTYLPQKKLGLNATVMCEFWGENSFFTQITGTRLTLLFARIDLDEFIGFRSW